MRALALVLLLCAACKTAPAPDEDVIEQYPDELQVQDLSPGTGETAIAGLNVVVHYTGTLTSGQAVIAACVHHQIERNPTQRHVERVAGRDLVQAEVTDGGRASTQS